MRTDTLHNPSALVHELRLPFNASQFDALGRIWAGYDDQPWPADFQQDPLHSMEAPAAAAALWHMLKNNGKVTVISSERRTAQRFMRLVEVIVGTDPALKSICRWTSWSTLRIGSDAGVVMRYVAPAARRLAGFSAHNHMLVVFGEGSSDPTFRELSDGMQKLARLARSPVIRLW